LQLLPSGGDILKALFRDNASWYRQGKKARSMAWASGFYLDFKAG
jgi:hypothetical protein